MYEVTADGKTEHPLGENPRGAILYTPDGYMSAQLAGPGPDMDDDRADAYYIAYSGPYDIDQTNQSAAPPTTILNGDAGRNESPLLTLLATNGDADLCIMMRRRNSLASAEASIGRPSGPCVRRADHAASA